MANRFYTLLVIPEKTSQVRRVIVPAWMLRGAAVAFAFVTLVALVMILDYWFVMNQIGENKELRMENRRLRQQVQVFKNKMTTIESTMERVKTFATRLKVITNIEDRGGLLQSLNQKLPDAGSNIGLNKTPQPFPVVQTSSVPGQPAQPGQLPQPVQLNLTPTTQNSTPANEAVSAALNPAQSATVAPLSQNPEDVALRKEYELLDDRFSELSQGTLFVEQMLQDQYELLADQKAFLAALPTRKPAVGYFTSGFGVRKSPIGDRVKMHEGLDIANRPGTPVKAPADGVVVYTDSKSGYGQVVILDHGYGLETWYGHLRKSNVQKGQRVRRGDQIALLGNSGRSTGPHVHYEVRVHGTPVDPLSYILEN